LTSNDFLEKVHPYKKLLKLSFYDDLLKYYLNAENIPGKNVLPPRNTEINSKIINVNIVSLISKCIDKIDIKSKFVQKSELYLPYEFKLLLRGSQEGFTPKEFHSLCDDKPRTVTFIKVKGTKEILGGYNPLTWKSNGKWCECKDSFIFSFKIKNNFFNDVIFSNAKYTNYALYCDSDYGPSFGTDLVLHSSESGNYDDIFCDVASYDAMIRDTGDRFSIEDYEVFQILKK